MTIAESNNGDFSSHPDPAELSHKIYADLRRLAESYFRNQPSDHTLQATALVHEAYLKVDPWGGDFKDEKHQFRVLARAMRQVLTDYARRRNAAKRGGGLNEKVLHENSMPVVPVDDDLPALDEALDELRRKDERMADVVELRFFGGLTVDQTADILGVSPRTVDKDWELAQAWLSSRLSDDAA